MAKRLTISSRGARTAKALSPYFDIQISGNSGGWFSVDKNDILPNYRYSHSVDFGASSFSFTLRNSLSGNSPRLVKYHVDSMDFGWNSPIMLYEGYNTKGTTETIPKFKGLIRQLDKKNNGGMESIEITAYDNIIRLKETDLDKTYEAEKTKIRELLTPNLSQILVSQIGTLSEVTSKKYDIQFSSQDIHDGVKSNINKMGVVFLPEVDKFFKYDIFSQNTATNTLSFSGVDWGVINNNSTVPADGSYKFEFYKPVAYIFDGSKQNWAGNPAPVLQWDIDETTDKDSSTDGFEVNFIGGQIITPPTEAVRILDFYLSGTYYYYPSGILVEDIIKDIMTQNDSFDKPVISGGDLTTNYFTANGNNDNLTPLDTLTPVTTVYTSSENTKLDESILADDVLNGTGYTVRGTNLANFDSSGLFDINGEIFSYTGKSGFHFTGVIRASQSTTARKHKRFDVIRQAYAPRQVFLFDYDNITDTIETSYFSGITANPAVSKVSTRYGRMVLSSPDTDSNTIIYSGSSDSGWVVASGNYNFTTLQATGVEVSKFRCDPITFEHRWDAILALRKIVAPNYIIHSKGDGKIWGEYINQKTSADYSLDLETSSASYQDTDIYTRVVVYGRPARPIDILKDKTQWNMVPAQLQTGRIIRGELVQVADFDKKKQYDYKLYTSEGAGVFEGTLVTGITVDSLTMVVKSTEYNLKGFNGDTIYLKQGRIQELISFTKMSQQSDGTYLFEGLIREKGNRHVFTTGANVFTMPKINILDSPAPIIYLDGVQIGGKSQKVQEQPMLIISKKHKWVTVEE